MTLDILRDWIFPFFVGSAKRCKENTFKWIEIATIKFRISYIWLICFWARYLWPFFGKLTVRKENDCLRYTWAQKCCKIWPQLIQKWKIYLDEYGIKASFQTTYQRKTVHGQPPLKVKFLETFRLEQDVQGIRPRRVSRRIRQTMWLFSRPFMRQITYAMIHL